MDWNFASTTLLLCVILGIVVVKICRICYDEGRKAGEQDGRDGIRNEHIRERERAYERGVETGRDTAYAQIVNDIQNRVRGTK